MFYLCKWASKLLKLDIKIIKLNSSIVSPFFFFFINLNIFRHHYSSDSRNEHPPLFICIDDHDSYRKGRLNVLKSSWKLILKYLTKTPNQNLAKVILFCFHIPQKAEVFSFKCL